MNAYPPRQGFRALFSAREQVLLLVGGERPSGRLTHDIWRLDLASGVWEREIVAGPGVEKVLAAAYDTASGSILLVDETAGSAAQARLIRYSRLSRRSHLLATFARTGLYDAISLVSRQDGTFVLLGSRTDGSQVEAFRFTLGSAVPVVWTGQLTRAGRLADNAKWAPYGLGVPMLQAAGLRMTVIDDADFTWSWEGPSEL